MPETKFHLPVLDHGYVKLLNLSGPIRREGIFDADDSDPSSVARISFNQRNKERTKEQDYALYEYLIGHRHNTPCEMLETWWEVKLPIFLARQFVRHRTSSINEISARYSTLPAEWYIPEVVGGKAKSNKQGQEDNLSLEVQEEFKNDLIESCYEGYRKYTTSLENGIAPEHARLFLSLNHYTTWVWKIDLYNLMHFLSLRCDSHAQIEARLYAEAKYDLLKQFLPKSMELFDIYRRTPSVEEKEVFKLVLENGNRLLTEEQREVFSRLKYRFEKEMR